MVSFAAGLAPDCGAAAPNYSRIELMQGATGLGDGSPLLLGIRIEPRPGWKTYWRAPGESGLPPVFTFLAHDNMAKPDIRWPAPKRLRLQGQESYGYDGPVIFPFYVQPQDAARPARLAIQVDYAVCLDICVPEQALLDVTLAPGASAASPRLAALQAALASVPRQQDENSPRRVIAAYVMQNGANPELRVEAEASQPFGPHADLFVDGVQDFIFSAPGISYSKDRRKASIRLGVLALDPSKALGGQTVVLTLTDGESAIEAQVKLAQQPGTE